MWYVNASFVHVIICMEYMHTCVLVEARGWLQVSSSIIFLPYFLRHCYSLNAEIIDSARLAGYQALGIHLPPRPSPPQQCKGYRCAQYIGFMWLLETLVQPFMLACQVLYWLDLGSAWHPLISALFLWIPWHLMAAVPCLLGLCFMYVLC